MSTIDFTNVKKGTYVYIDGIACKSVTIDDVKVWEYSKQYTFDGDGWDSYTNAVTRYKSFNGQNYYWVDITNQGSGPSYIQAHTTYKYPVGQTTVTMRDGEYFLTMNVQCNDGQGGSMSVDVNDVPVTFNKTFKEIYIGYDCWTSGAISGLDTLRWRVVTSDGVTSEWFDFMDAESGTTYLKSNNGFNKINFEFDFEGSSYVTTKKVENAYLIIDAMWAFE